MNTQSIKESAKAFLELIVKGNPRQAFHKYVGEGFKHHNTGFKGDAESLCKAMEADAAAFPNKVFTIQHVLHDGDWVAVHAHIQQNAEDRGFAVVHIFRFSADKIVELWDLVQEIPANSVNEHGMF
ncbi:MAG: ester cyclase [Salinivirgaceae bacterium]